MAVSRFSRRILTLVALGVGVPALLLAVLAVFLTLRISREVARESLNYNDYIARQVVQAGGLERTRRLSVMILGPGDVEVGRVRTPYTHHTAATQAMSGPLEHYRVRVAPTENAPVVWTDRFVTLEISFIVLMALAIIVASS